MISLLTDLDTLLTSSNIPHFSLSAWIASARAWAPSQSSNTTAAAQPSTTSSIADFYEYNARNQITLWGPDGEISDYASKQWGGLISSYYVPRWQMFVDSTLNALEPTAANGQNDALAARLLAFEEDWQMQRWGQEVGESFAPKQGGDLQWTMAQVVGRWPDVFGL